MTPGLLIIDRDEDFAVKLGATLEELGYRIFETLDRESASEVLAEKAIAVVLLGMNRSKNEALDDLSWLKSHFPSIEVIVFADRGHFRSAFSAMTRDAFDFLVKSSDVSEFIPIIVKAYQQAVKHIKAEGLGDSASPGRSKTGSTSSEMIGFSRQNEDVLDLIAKVAPTDASVLLLGETGVGKELAANLIHRNSKRRHKSFVSINCGAIPEALFENELFGHAKGAFTDAISVKRGLLEEADGGTLFLDEVSEMPLGLQVKLLRFLEAGVFRRLGDNSERHADVRVIAATNRNLGEEVAQRRFRSDLYYRLAVVPLILSPLRERRDDIALLAEHFFNLQEPAKGKKRKISKGALKMLTQYDWPGNVREVRNIMERLTVISENETISANDVETAFSFSPGIGSVEELKREQAPMNGNMNRHHRRLLELLSADMRKAADALKISPELFIDEVLHHPSLH